jgi:hypothetical protein
VVARDDWYRGSAWDRRTRESFEDKLSRARPHTRAQYLRIKGLGLTASESSRVRGAGRDLLRRVLDEHPEDELQIALAHCDLAQSLASDRSFVDAVEHYRAAMRGPRNVVTHAELGFAEVVLQAGWSDRYDEALDMLLRSPASHDPFPALRFRWNLAAARLASRCGHAADAKELAELALRALDETEPPFPRHKKLGLASADQPTIEELHRIAAES